MPHEGDTRFDEHFRLALDASPCAMVLVDAQGQIRLVNDAVAALFGYEPDELLGRPVETLVPDTFQEAHRGHRAGFLSAPRVRPMGRRRDLMGRRSDGADFPIEIGLNPLSTSHGVYVIGAIVDLTERKHLEHRITAQAQRLEEANVRLSEMAATDSLTDLWNRRSFLDQLTVQMELALRTTRPMSLLILDLDQFKPYNDQFGHLAGDEVLRMAAALMCQQARRSDYVARIGGEEFAIILPETDRAGALTLGERFRVAIEGATWPRRPMTVSIGGGTLTFERPDVRPEPDWRSRLLRGADRALYLSKQRGRNCVTHESELSPEG
jgi:diguanylate cyclase (GGDEF)-like protein/PAS domain S-box-containing protein